MKTNLKNKIKGITLVALVVTIVVLLILAGVTIVTLFGENGIITAAQKAADQTKNGVKNDLEDLKELEDWIIDSQSDGKWVDNGNGTFTCGSKTLTIGDYVDYDPGSYTHTPDTKRGIGTYASYGGDKPCTLSKEELTTKDNFKWRTLGVNSEGKLELISDNPTTKYLYLANDEGWLNVETIYNDNGSVKQLGTLDTLCNDLYGKGNGAIGARSLNVNDIDKISKYDKTTYKTYGEKYQYQFPVGGSCIQYRNMPVGGSWGDWIDVTAQHCTDNYRTPIDKVTINSGNPGIGRELENTDYSYSLADNITAEDGYASELATDIVNMIMKGTGNSNIGQWLSNKCIESFFSDARFKIRCLQGSGVSSNGIVYSRVRYDRSNKKVRPVVTLETGVKLSGRGENLGTEANPYKLSK